MFVGMVWRQIIIFKYENNTLLISSAAPSCQPLCSVKRFFCFFVFKVNLPHSGRSKRPWGFKTSMIKIRMASWIERSSSDGSRPTATVQRERRWVSTVLTCACGGKIHQQTLLVYPRIQGCCETLEKSIHLYRLLVVVCSKSHSHLDRCFIDTWWMPCRKLLRYSSSVRQRFKLCNMQGFTLYHKNK